jgi:hypothetical protein
MNKRPFVTSLVLIAMLLTAPFSHATTVQRLALDELVKKANRIVVGKVGNSRTYWSDNGKLILTSYTIEVSESIKGQASRSVELTTIGGKIGDLELHVAGMPSFVKGEETVVFLEDSHSFQIVVGLGQGKFTVTNGEISNQLDGLSFPDGLPGRNVRMPLEKFKNQIKSLVRP